MLGKLYPFPFGVQSLPSRHLKFSTSGLQRQLLLLEFSKHSVNIFLWYIYSGIYCQSVEKNMLTYPPLCITREPEPQSLLPVKIFTPSCLERFSLDSISLSFISFSKAWPPRFVTYRRTWESSWGPFTKSLVFPRVKYGLNSTDIG